MYAKIDLEKFKDDKVYHRREFVEWSLDPTSSEWAGEQRSPSPASYDDDDALSPLH